jgi:glycosyltransferase involved in cell wall biosynthesis
MSTGLPPVLSNIPAHTQLVEHEVHGLITQVGDEESIARGLQQVLDDQSLREGMGRAARQRMKDVFSIDRVADRYESLFQSVLNGRDVGDTETQRVELSAESHCAHSGLAGVIDKAGAGSQS